MALLIATPGWIRKAVILCIVLATPALLLLLNAQRDRSQQASGRLRTPLAIWAGFTFLATYIVWLANVTLEISVGVMIGWPLLGIFLAIVGCGSSLTLIGEDRKRLFIANALLLILAIASVVAPN